MDDYPEIESFIEVFSFVFGYGSSSPAFLELYNNIFR